MNNLSASASRVQNVLDEKNIPLEIIKFETTTHTAQQAADTIGCDVGQILKSLIFIKKPSMELFLVAASGKNRINTKILKKYFGEKVTPADPKDIFEKTGYRVGGVPPIGHKEKLTTIIDSDLLDYDAVWASGGTEFEVFKVTPEQLVDITGGTVLDIK